MTDRGAGLNSPQDGLCSTQYPLGLWKHRPEGRTNGSRWLRANPAGKRAAVIRRRLAGGRRAGGTPGGKGVIAHCDLLPQNFAARAMVVVLGLGSERQAESIDLVDFCNYINRTGGRVPVMTRGEMMFEQISTLSRGPRTHGDKLRPGETGKDPR